MQKSLIKHGNSLAMVIDKPILELLQITSDTKLEVSTNGDAILLTPIRDKQRQAQIQKSLKTINETFGEDLQRLSE